MDLTEPIHEPLFEGLHLRSIPTINVSFTAEQIDNIKNDQIISTRNGDCRRYLVRWKDHLEFDDIWITRENMQ